MSKIKTILRWIAVLPAAFLGGILITFPIHWFVITNFREGGSGCGYNEPIMTVDEDILRQIEYFLMAFLVPIAFIWFGSQTAPAYRKVVSVILATFIVAGIDGAAIFYLKVMENSHSIIPWYVSIIGNIVGSVGGAYIVFSKENGDL